MSYDNGNRAVYDYDALNRLTSLTHQDSNAVVIAGFDYTLNATGRRTQIVEQSGRTTSYAYDDLNRILTETIRDPVNADYSASYSYDTVGNRIQSVVDGVTTAFGYDDNDRLLQQGGTTYSYDDNGNTLTEILDGNTKLYTYNTKNQLVETDNTGGVTRYQYNADGIRTGQTTGLETTGYVVDSNRDYAQVLQESANGAEIVSYTYGDDLVSQTRQGETHHYHYDGLGSTRYLSDASGTLTDRYDYEAFGQLLNETGSTENSYRFAGEQLDQNLDQYYLRARYYNQYAGRFTQMDTWMGNSADPVTLHKYLYGNSDPANFTDPTGNFSLGSVGVTIAIAGSFGGGFTFGDGYLNDGKFHSYKTKNTICIKSQKINNSCTFENVFYALRLFPAPGALGIDPVYNGQKSYVTLLGNVEHTVTSGTIINQTLSDHLLHGGLAIRTVIDSGNSISVETYGEGTGPFPILNSFFSDALWSSIDANIARTVRVNN